jgi:hypothetical protein
MEPRENTAPRYRPGRVRRNSDSSMQWNFFATVLCLLLSACAERPLIGVTVTNSPDTLPCASGKSCR